MIYRDAPDKHVSTCEVPQPRQRAPLASSAPGKVTGDMQHMRNLVGIPADISFARPNSRLSGAPWEACRAPGDPPRRQ